MGDIHTHDNISWPTVGNLINQLVLFTSGEEPGVIIVVDK